MGNNNIPESEVELAQMVRKFRQSYTEEPEIYKGFSEAQDRNDLIPKYICDSIELRDLTALEIGAGFGRHAKCLGKCFKEYLAVEPSTRLSNEIEEIGLDNVKVINRRIQDIELSKRIDVILSFWADIDIQEFVDIANTLDVKYSVLVMNSCKGEFSGLWPEYAREAWANRAKILQQNGYAGKEIITSFQFKNMVQAEKILKYFFVAKKMEPKTVLNQIAYVFVKIRDNNEDYGKGVISTQPKTLQKKANLRREIGLEYRNSYVANADFETMCLANLEFSDMTFHNCSFANSDLSGTVFKNCDLYKSRFDSAVLYSTTFKDCVLIRTGFDNAFLYGVIFENIDPTLATFENLQFEDSFRQTYLKEDMLFPEVPVFGKANVNHRLGYSYYSNGLAIKYRAYQRGEKELRKAETFNIIKRTLRQDGYEETAANFYYKEMVSRRKSMKFSLKKVLQFTYESVCGYGEKILRLLAWLFFVNLSFSITYSVLPMISKYSYIVVDNRKIALNSSNDPWGYAIEVIRNFYHSVIMVVGIDYFNIEVSGLCKTIFFFHRLLTYLLFVILIPVIIRRIIRD